MLIVGAELSFEALCPFLEEGYVKMFLRGRPVTMYMPKDQVESYNLEAKADLPAKKLKLDWVYPFVFIPKH